MSAFPKAETPFSTNINDFFVPPLLNKGFDEQSLQNPVIYLSHEC